MMGYNSNMYSLAERKFFMEVPIYVRTALA